MTKDATEKHLASIDRTLKKLAKKLGVDDEESFVSGVKRLSEPEPDAVSSVRGVKPPTGASGGSDAVSRKEILAQMAREGQEAGMPDKLPEGGLRRLSEPTEDVIPIRKNADPKELGRELDAKHEYQGPANPEGKPVKRLTEPGNPSDDEGEWLLNPDNDRSL